MSSIINYAINKLEEHNMSVRGTRNNVEAYWLDEGSNPKTSYVADPTVSSAVNHERMNQLHVDRIKYEENRNFIKMFQHYIKCFEVIMVSDMQKDDFNFARENIINCIVVVRNTQHNYQERFKFHGNIEKEEDMKEFNNIIKHDFQKFLKYNREKNEETTI